MQVLSKRKSNCVVPMRRATRRGRDRVCAPDIIDETTSTEVLFCSMVIMRRDGKAKTGIRKCYEFVHPDA
jgi:hypothetical protein